MNSILLTILTGGVLGVLGQGVRVLIGLKKLREASGGSEETYDKLLSVSRIVISIFIGFVTGGVAALSMGKEINSPDVAFSLIGIGYLGVDFIEGLFLQRVQPVLSVLQTSGGQTGGTAPTTSSESVRALVREEVAASLPTSAMSASTGSALSEVNTGQAFVVGYPFRLSGSVGRGGLNRPQDVRALKEKFHQLGYNWLTLNETADGELFYVINLFQSIIRGSAMVSGDGLVSVPGSENSSYRWLQAENAPRWTKLGTGSLTDKTLGYWNYTINDTPADYFGTHWLIDTIEEAGRNYYHGYVKNNLQASVIHVNDLSEARGGKVADHAGHQTGLMADIRLPRVDGKSGGISWNSPTYDRAAARAIITAFRNTSIGVKHVLFNDETLMREGICRASAGHDDHIHLQIKIPSKLIALPA